MTEPLTLSLWLLLAVVQQHGSVAMTFGEQATCIEVRDGLRPAKDTIALSNCVPIELVGVPREPPPAPLQEPPGASTTPTWPPVPP